MSDRRGALLIGGNGFYGLTLAHAMVNAGYRVHIASRHAVPGQRNGIEFHQGGQDGTAIMAPLLGKCEVVVHLASTTTPGSSARRPRVDVEENLLPAAALIELMVPHPPERLIFVSSGGAIYGNPPRLPVGESTTPQPLSYHAAGKLALESQFSVFAQASNIPLAILRPSNLYGPGQHMRHGFGFVRTLLEKALRNEPVEIWGDGSAVRDYLFIDDAVEACLQLIDNLDTDGPFNVGSGAGTSIRDLIGVVEDVTGRELTITQRPARGTDVSAIVLETTRLQTATSWTPRIGLEEGLRRTWAWLQETEQ